MTVVSTAVDTRARVARRLVAVLLVLAGLVACALSLLGERAEALGDFRFLMTMTFHSICSAFMTRSCPQADRRRVWP